MRRQGTFDRVSNGLDTCVINPLKTEPGVSTLNHCILCSPIEVSFQPFFIEERRLLERSDHGGSDPQSISKYFNFDINLHRRQKEITQNNVNIDVQPILQCQRM